MVIAETWESKSRTSRFGFVFVFCTGDIVCLLRLDVFLVDDAFGEITCKIYDFVPTLMIQSSIFLVPPTMITQFLSTHPSEAESFLILVLFP